MIQVTIDNKVFELPSSWEDLTLRHFLDIMNVREDKHLSDIENFVKTICIISEDKGLEDAINSLPFEDFKIVREAFSWMNEDPILPKNAKEIFEIEGERWTIRKEHSQITTGEAISIEMMLKDKKLDLHTHEIAFGVLFRKLDAEGKELPFDAKKIQTIIKDYSPKVKFMDVYPTLRFFLPSEKTSTPKSSRVYLQVVKKPQTNLPPKVKAKKK